MMDDDRTVSGIAPVRIRGCSMAIAVTEACRELGIGVGDLVEFTIRKVGRPGEDL